MSLPGRRRILPVAVGLVGSIVTLMVLVGAVSHAAAHREGGALGFSAGSSTSVTTTPAQGDDNETRFLKRARRLTYEGRRAGEGYFSADGLRLTFQSEREPGNPFYQIYELDLTTGDTRRVSPGVGNTTCSFFHPKTLDILFGSTHLDPDILDKQRAEYEMREAGNQPRYSWSYETAMDIFVSERATGELRRLTDAVGYDAEASFSSDGRWIAFTSLRNAYNRDLSEHEQRMLETDPAYFADIYIMRADGSEQRQLTTSLGYDGGPFFFPDSSRIIWRHFDESGLTADVFSMKLDGSDERRLTDFGSMSWAPYVHPSLEYVIFGSNKLDFENFELYLVDIDGTKEPVRVTYTEGFDHLPVPSPDGTRLIWTSTRHDPSARLGQLYTADWDHEAARQAIAAAPLRQASSLDPTEDQR